MSPEDQEAGGQTWPREPIPAPPIPPYSAVAIPTPHKSTSADAIVAFILSLVSWAVCPIIFAIVALIFAAKAEKALAASPSTVGGSGLNLAAKLIAWINIGFWLAVIFIGGFIALVLLLAGAGSEPAHP